MRTHVYIDASNLFYGGKKSLGWSVDFEKLHHYFRTRFQASEIYYFGGVETHTFPFDYLTHDTVPLAELEAHIVAYTEKHKDALTAAKLALLDRHLTQVHFYQKLAAFGYQLILKPVKTYTDENDNQKRKANCDVEMAFYLMRDQDDFDRVVVLSGDGDFLPVLKHLREIGKEVLILARGPRTAREIRRFAGDKFMDFTDNLRTHLERIA